MDRSTKRSADDVLAHYGIVMMEEEEPEVSPVEAYLSHWGVLGMKWGVRKDRRAGPGPASKAKKAGRASKAGDVVVNKKGVIVDVPLGTKVNKRTPTNVSKSYKNLYVEKVPLSDADLKNRIDRLQMEKRFVELTKKEKSAGRKFADKAIKDVGSKLVQEFIKEAITPENTAAFLAKMSKKR